MLDQSKGLNIILGYSYALMGKPGFEDEKNRINQKLSAKTNYSV